MKGPGTVAFSAGKYGLIKFMDYGLEPIGVDGNRLQES